MWGGIKSKEVELIKRSTEGITYSHFETVWGVFQEYSSMNRLDCPMSICTLFHSSPEKYSIIAHGSYLFACEFLFPPGQGLVENIAKKNRSRFPIAVLLTTLICSH